MKRYIALILVLVMTTLTFGAFAEQPEQAESSEQTEQTEKDTAADEEAKAAGDTFNFRNGITWGMSLDEVRELENRDETSCREDGDVTALMYGYTDVSKYTADYLLYLFVNNELRSAVYIFTKNWDDSQYKYLTNALTQVYGEPTEMTKDEITAEMNFYSGFDGSEIESAYGWDAGSALVRIARDSEIDITYLDPSFSYEEAAASCNTKGL